MASVGVGVLGAVLCLPPHVETLRGFLCMAVCTAEQSLFTGEMISDGLRWDRCTAPSPGCCPHWAPMEKGFLRWLHAGGTTYFLGPFVPCVMDQIHQGSTRSAFRQSFQTVSTPCKAREICHVICCVNASNNHMFPWHVQVPDLARANFLLAGSLGLYHGSARTGTDQCLSNASDAHCPCLGLLPVVQVTSSTRAWFPTAMVGRLEEESRVTAGETQWWEGEWLNLKHLGSPGHMLQLAKGYQGFCSLVFGRAVVSSLPSADHRGL